MEAVMADRVPASIEIGGNISAAVFAELLHIIAFEGLSPEWGGEPFDAESRVVGQPLAMFDESCAWGKIDNLEAFCVEHGLSFVRRSEEHTSELQSLLRISSAVFWLKKKTNTQT